MVRVAILGQGRSGHSIHGAHLLKNRDQFQVVAICDRIQERREKRAAAFDCEAIDDYKKLLDRKDIDLILNCLPSPYHCPVTLEFLAKGFRVLTEKPMAPTAADAQKMMDVGGDRLYVFQQSRLAPYYQKIKEVIASGVLGRLVSVNIRFNGFARRWDWQCVQKNVAGSLFNTGPHPVDQALDTLGFECDPQVWCRMDRALTFGDAEDYVKLLLTAPGKPVVDLEISSADAFPSGTYNIQGTQGGLWASTSEVKWKYFDPASAPEQKLISTPLTTPEGEPAYCGEKLEMLEGHWVAGAGENPFEAAVASYYREMYDHITQGKPMTVQPWQVKKQIAVIEECHRQNPLSRMYEEATV